MLGIGFAGVALAFGLTLLTMAFAIGDISGCHINPAVTVGLGRHAASGQRDLSPTSWRRSSAASSPAASSTSSPAVQPDSTSTSGFASNGFGEHSPGHFALLACAVCEVVMTSFSFSSSRPTDKRALAGFAPIAIGLALTLIHLISIPVTNTSVNPARSTGAALFVGGWAIEQLWLFWLAPILGVADRFFFFFFFFFS